MSAVGATADTPRTPAWPDDSRRIVALVPAHNEEDCIAGTIESLLTQDRPLDEIVVICDNCTDRTQEIASGYPVIVISTEGNTHGKSGALNLGWQHYAQQADIVVCADADTILPPSAARLWAVELMPGVGGISGQVVMTGDSMLERMQRAEFSKSAQMGLGLGYVSVISGTGCCFSGPALREVAQTAPERAPWSNVSITEDFHLTYQLRRAGWKTIMSSLVPVHTRAMPTLRALWHQRMKWHVGTISDLLSFGINRLTWRDWLKQAFGLLLIVFWVLYFTALALTAYLGLLHFTWLIFVIPVFFSVTEAWQARLVNGRTWKDIALAASLIPTYFYAGLTIGLLITSWLRCLMLRVSVPSLWSAQYRAERRAARS